MSAPGLSQREFARRDGCNEKLVRRGIALGRLTLQADGTIDAALVGTGWRSANRRLRGADTKPVSARTVRSADNVADQPVEPAAPFTEGAKPIPATPDDGMTYAEAERRKEMYLARLRQLEYDQKAGRVVLVEDVAAIVGAEYAKVRTQLLALPAAIAPSLARSTSPAQVQAKLAQAIHRVLAELNADSPARPPT